MNLLDAIRQRHAQLQRKSALADLYPHLAQREHLYSSAVQPGRDLAILDDYAGYAHTYRSYGWVKKAITITVQNIAPLPVRVVNAKGEAQPGHELSRLFAQPNDQQAPSQLWEETLTPLLIGGEWFVEIVDDGRQRPRELWARRPDQVEIEPDDTRLNYPRPRGYVFTDEQRNAIAIPASGMIRDKFTNPLNVWRGISPIAAVRHGITIDVLAQAWTKQFLKKGARPDFAITSEQLLLPDELKRLQEEIADKFGGVENAHKPIILHDKTRVQPFSFAPKDLEWLEQRRYSRDEVGAIFGVPDEIMGYGKDTYENFETALRVLWTLTLLPIIQRRDVVLSHFFSTARPLLRPGERIATDVSSVGVLQEDDGPRIQKAQNYWAMGVPFNTLDERLKLGIGPIPGGEIGYLPANLLPANEAVQPLPPRNSDDQQQRTIRALTIESKAARATRRATRAARQLQRIRKQIAKEMTPEIDDYFAALAETVVERATKAWTAPVRKDLPSIDVLFELEDREDLRLIVQRFYAEIIEASWDTWNEGLGTDIAFDLDDPIVADVLKTAGQRIKQIEDTTKAAVQQLLVYGAEQGWSIQQLVKGDDDRPGLRALVEETYKGRARTIARTELGEAQQKAATLRFEDAGVDRVLVLDDGSKNSDERCKQLNNTVQTLAWAKANLLQHPNCVRAFAPYFED